MAVGNVSPGAVVLRFARLLVVLGRRSALVAWWAATGRLRGHRAGPVLESWLVGTVVELDRQVGEAVEIYVNDRLVARGEIVLVESRLGVTMTEIIKAA